MSKFEKIALAYFEKDVGRGIIQRVDGIECFSPLSDFWFWRIRLNRMVRRGLLVKRGIGSIWPSCDGLPGYGLANQSPQPNLLVTHIRPTVEGDSVEYAYKVCATGDDGAIPVYFGPPAHISVSSQMVGRFIDAVEGELDGLAIDTEQAMAILAYTIAGETTPQPRLTVPDISTVAGHMKDFEAFVAPMLNAVMGALIASLAECFASVGDPRTRKVLRKLMDAELSRQVAKLMAAGRPNSPTMIVDGGLH